MVDANGGPLDDDEGTTNRAFIGQILAGSIAGWPRLALFLPPGFRRKFRQGIPGQNYTPMLARGLSFGFQSFTNSASFSSAFGKTIINVTS